MMDENYTVLNAVYGRGKKIMIQPRNQTSCIKILKNCYNCLMESKSN